MMFGGNGLEAKYAPMGGPIQKQMANAIPTEASALLRFAAEVMSDSMAMASWTFPSLNPPMTLDNMYEANVVD